MADVRDTTSVADPVRTVRVDDELWDRAVAKAKRRRENMAVVIRRALLTYVEEEEPDAGDR